VKRVQGLRDTRRSLLAIRFVDTKRDLERLTLLLGFTNLELGDVEAIHIVHVRVEPPRQFDTFSKLFASESLEPFFSEGESGIDELDVRSFT